MFKKVTPGAQNKLRGTDVKRLKKDISLQLPALSEADVDALLPSKCAAPQRPAPAQARAVLRAAPPGAAPSLPR